MAKLRLILGDQLNSKHSWFKKNDPQTYYLLAEMRQETDYVKHHIQKVVAFFMAMRNFAKLIKSRGHNVIYFCINDSNNPQQLDKIIAQTIETYNIDIFEYLLPDEFRLDIELKQICKKITIKAAVFDTEHFFTTRTELAEFYYGKESLLMESFYRHMRKKHDILMVGDHPLGGKWNFDHSNRNKYKGEVPVPAIKNFNQNVSAVLEEVRKSGVRTFGTINPENFQWPISREESLEILKHFCLHLLEHFGDYQDAMQTGEAYLFHSRLSFAMNSKMISPKEVIRTVLNFYNTHKDQIDIAEIEGFVRQIIGWREYMRGVYWKEMPEFAQKNVLQNHNKLPYFYWNAETKMNCLKNALGQSLEKAYAHHIQRLMVIGNFALLTQTNPDEVDQWYLGVYIDAIQWVEITNTRGMSQFADGGIIATKPYISSGSYINKMSNYCRGCHYNVKERLGEKACPFNSLYWNFLDDKREFFNDNPRMTMMLSLLDKIKPSELAKIKQKAKALIQNVDSL